MHGLAYGCFPAILRDDLDLHSIYVALKEDDWESFNIGLINACFRLENPTELWSILKQLSEMYQVPVMLPSIEVRPILEQYSDQISVLGYFCMVPPGAIRGYIQKFDKDPVTLKLLGWWLALEMTSDTDRRWLYLKLGPDFMDCIDYILKGMKGMRDGIPFLNILCEHPMNIYRGTDNRTQRKIEFIHKEFWSPNKIIWPYNKGLSKRDIEDCNLINN